MSGSTALAYSSGQRAVGVGFGSVGTQGCPRRQQVTAEMSYTLQLSALQVRPLHLASYQLTAHYRHVTFSHYSSNNKDSSVDKILDGIERIRQVEVMDGT